MLLYSIEFSWRAQIVFGNKNSAEIIIYNKFSRFEHEMASTDEKVKNIFKVMKNSLFYCLRDEETEEMIVGKNPVLLNLKLLYI